MALGKSSSRSKAARGGQPRPMEVLGPRPSSMVEDGLFVDSIGKSFRGRAVVKSVSLRLHRGEAMHEDDTADTNNAVQGDEDSDSD